MSNTKISKISLEDVHIVQTQSLCAMALNRKPIHGIPFVEVKNLKNTKATQKKNKKKY